SLVPVALGENRYIMPAMPLGPEARVVGIPEATHADVGGSFNPQGIQAVTLGLARDFLSASGMDLPELPPHLQPDWSQMWAHESSLDNYGNRLWSVHGSERYFEGADRTAPTLPERLRQQTVSPEQQAWLDKARQELGPRLEAAGFSTEMCERIMAGCVCQVAGQAAAGAPAPRFLLSRDQQQLGVLHPSGVLQEMRLDELMTVSRTPEETRLSRSDSGIVNEEGQVKAIPSQSVQGVDGSGARASTGNAEAWAR